MLDLTYNGEKIFKPLEGKMEWITEEFVNFWGEDFREHLEREFASAEYLCLGGLNSEVYEKVMEKSDALVAAARAEFESAGYGVFVGMGDKPNYDLIRIEAIANEQFNKERPGHSIINRRILNHLGILKRDMSHQEFYKFITDPENLKVIIEKIVEFAKGICQSEEYKNLVKFVKENKSLDELIKKSTNNISNYARSTFKEEEMKRVSLRIIEQDRESFMRDRQLIEELGTSVGGCVSYYLDNEKNMFKVLKVPNLLNLDTQVVIHEIGHIALSRIIDGEFYKGEKVTKSGLDLQVLGSGDSKLFIKFDDFGNIRDDFQDDGIKVKRTYELLNEVVHDIFATRIREEYEKKFGRIGYKPNFKSQYNDGFDVFEPFVNRHFEAFKTCMKSNDFEPVKKYFGFKIYNQIAKIANDYVLAKSSLSSKIERVKEKIDNPEYAGEIDFLNDLLNKTKVQIERLTKKYNCQLLRVDLELHKRNGMETSQVEQLLAEAEAEAAPIYAEEERERREEEQRLEEERRAEEAEAEKERLAEEARIKEEERKAKLLKRCEGFFYPLYVEYDDEKKTLKYTYDGVLRTSKNYPLLYKYLNKIATSDKIESLLASIGQKLGKSEATYYDIRQNVKNMKILTEEERNFVKFVVESNELFHKMGKYVDKNYDKWVDDRIKERFDEDVEL